MFLHLFSAVPSIHGISMNQRRERERDEGVRLFLMEVGCYVVPGLCLLCLHKRLELFIFCRFWPQGSVTLTLIPWGVGTPRDSSPVYWVTREGA